MPHSSFCRTILSESIERGRRDFFSLCYREFDSADLMAAEIAEAGGDIHPKRCQRLRNGTAKKIWDADRRAVEFVLDRRKALAEIQQHNADLAAARAEVARLEGMTSL